MAEPIPKVSYRVVRRMVRAFLVLLMLVVPSDTDQGQPHVVDHSAKAVGQESTVTTKDIGQ